MHADQLTIAVETVRDLVDDQFPRWRNLPVTGVDSQGTVNAIFRIGGDLAFREDLGCDDRDWERGRVWAFEQALGLVEYYVDTNPVMSRMGRRTLERLSG
jgi:hypothetical protein